jgi:tetratricopeptide (TPR) repeat protein
MTPNRPFPPSFLQALFCLLISAIALAPAPAQAPFRVLDPVSRSGFDHFYSLEYDQAIQDFQKGLKDDPNDPNKVNYLLEAVLFRELYRCNALDTRMYTHQRFINAKQVVIDAAVKKQIKDLTNRAIGIADQRLKANPEDFQATYSRGVTEGLHATYLAVAEKAWWSALRNALAARHDHEQVLKLQPGFVDAKTIVGAHNYVVGSLPLPVKVMAGITGIRGDKEKGLQYLAEAAKAGGESSADARSALGLFLRREGRFQEALDNLQALQHDHPRNFLFALEEGHLLMDSGKHAEATTAYRKVLAGCKAGQYPNAHVAMAQFGLGEALRSQGQYAEALQAYDAASAAGNNDKDLRQRALLSAGETADLLARRDEAVNKYQAAIAVDSSTEEAGQARKYVNKPYRNP